MIGINVCSAELYIGSLINCLHWMMIIHEFAKSQIERSIKENLEHRAQMCIKYQLLSVKSSAYIKITLGSTRACSKLDCKVFCHKLSRDYEVIIYQIQ